MVGIPAMTRSIFTNTDSGAGCLKEARIAEHIACLRYQLVDGPVPYTAQPLEFFAARTALWPPDTEDWKIEITSTEAQAQLLTDAVIAAKHGSVEIWCDPTVNAHLQLMQLLDWLRTNPHVRDKLFVAFLDQPLGNQTPEWAAGLKPVLVKAETAMFEAASSCWYAYRQSTPEAWFNLLATDLRIFPFFPDMMLRMLHELPEAQTGLMETQRLILQLVSCGCGTPNKLFSHPSWWETASVADYWQRGALLFGLARCPVPALTGLIGERFTLELHDDSNRLSAYWNSSLEFTDFGLALLHGRDDFARCNPIDRWWGGTRLTTDRLWRWDSRTQLLVEPA